MSRSTVYIHYIFFGVPQSMDKTDKDQQEIDWLHTKVCFLSETLPMVLSEKVYVSRT